MIDMLSNPLFLLIWGVSVAFGLSIVIFDLIMSNSELSTVMKAVWALTVAYSGLIGVALYYWSGRHQMSDDSLWKRACRSVAHCYAGCGAGEVIGVIISIGLFSLGQVWAGVLTFLLAYTLGILLNMGALAAAGEDTGTALEDSLISETGSIVVMEAVAIGVDFWLSGSAGITDTLFWSSMAVSLTAGLVAAYPVNLWLLHEGVKEGMADPREAPTSA